MKTNLKTSVVVLAAVLLLYTLAGFFLVPYVAKDQAIKFIRQSFDVQAEVQKIYFNPYTFELEVTNFSMPNVSGEDLSKDRLNIGRLYVNLQIFPLVTKEIRLKEFFLGATSAEFAVFKNGATNWAMKRSKDEADSSEEKTKDDSKPWILTVEKLAIEETRFNFIDRTHAEPLNLPLSPINISATNISTSLGKMSSLEQITLSLGNKGQAQISGHAGINPVRLDIKLTLTGVPLDFLSPYLSDQTHLAVGSGTLDLQGSVQYDHGVIKHSSNGNIRDFDLIYKPNQQSVMAWKDLEVVNLEFKTSPMSISMAGINVDELRSRVVINSDGTLNFKSFMKAKNEKEEVKEAQGASEKPSPSSTQISIQNIEFKNSQLGFADQTIKPHFAADIRQLAGSIGPVSSKADSKVMVNLTGKVEAEGKFLAKGFVIPVKEKPQMDLKLQFNNIELTTFSPYSGKFAGYEISKGKLFLDLMYTLQNQFIRGKNNAVLDQFTLGKRVESKDATNLPVKLALALLKDREGKLKINLPVEGNVNSPKFSFGGLIWTAFKNMIINIAAAPFDFVKGLLGGGDDLDLVLFEPGTSKLSDKEGGKLQQLAKVLVDRPNLVMEIQGKYQPADIEALKKSSRKKEIPEEDLKALAMQRGQLVQSTLAKLNVEAERLYLLAVNKEDSDAKPTHALLTLKSKD